MPLDQAGAAPGDRPVDEAAAEHPHAGEAADRRYRLAECPLKPDEAPAVTFEQALEVRGVEPLVTNVVLQPQ